MTLIARYYENASQAQAAQEALLGIGLGQSEMSLIEPGGDGAQANEEELAARAVKAGIFLGSKSDAPLDNLRRGYTLLAVKAPFGRALQATHLMDAQQPVAQADAGETAAEPVVLLSERAAPLSHVLGMKVLSDPSPGRTAANSMANRSFLTGSLSGSSNFSLSAMLGMRMLSSPAAPLSFMSRIMPPLSRAKSGDGWTRSFGFKMLSSHASPLSSLIGVHLLSGRINTLDYSPVEHRSKVRENAAPLSGFLRMKLLSSTPLSFMSRIMSPLTRSDFALLGKPNLSGNAAPLSSMLGMPVKSGKSGDAFKSSFGFRLLSSNPAPLSSFFGFSVLSDV